MAATDPTSEVELESALRSDPDFAIELIDEEYREQIIRHIKRVTWSRLSPDELLNAYQETMLAFIRLVREEGFDPCRPLRLVYRIGRNKGFDILRAKKHQMSTNEDAALSAIASSLKGTEVSQGWGTLTPSERREFREAVLTAVQDLPERQKIVAQCYVDCFEEVINEGSFRPLAKAVSDVTGQAETVVNVKSAWHAARKKIAAALRRGGFPFINAE